MTLYTKGFSHFVTSMTAPIASGRSDSCRVGLAPTEERRLSTAHTHSRLSQEIEAAPKHRPETTFCKLDGKAQRRRSASLAHHVLGRIADHKITKLDELMPWHYAQT